jgi:hypothetical protein
MDIRSFGGADCDTDHYLMVTKQRQRLSVSKRAAQSFDMEICRLKKLHRAEFKEQYQAES